MRNEHKARTFFNRYEGCVVNAVDRTKSKNNNKDNKDRTCNIAYLPRSRPTRAGDARRGRFPAEIDIQMVLCVQLSICRTSPEECYINRTLHPSWEDRVTIKFIRVVDEQLVEQKARSPLRQMTVAPIIPLCMVELRDHPARTTMGRATVGGRLARVADSPVDPTTTAAIQTIAARIQCQYEQHGLQ